MKKPRRPRDFAQLGKLVVDIATGAAPRDPELSPETPLSWVRRKAGQKGGKARAKRLSAKKRREISRGAAHARWSTDGKKIKSIP
jgi:hypothetical protein